MTDHKLTPDNNGALPQDQTAGNRCYPSDSEATATGGDGTGNGFYVGAAATLLAESQYIDPGLSRASLPPIGSAQRERFERVRDHYIAYGIRHALDNLGLMPDD